MVLLIIVVVIVVVVLCVCVWATATLWFLLVLCGEMASALSGDDCSVSVSFLTVVVVWCY